MARKRLATSGEGEAGLVYGGSVIPAPVSLGLAGLLGGVSICYIHDPL